eukprot:scaffold47206_cov69-Phaeocystis_antarctica.AAC.4
MARATAAPTCSPAGTASTACGRAAAPPAQSMRVRYVCGACAVRERSCVVRVLCVCHACAMRVPCDAASSCRRATRLTPYVSKCVGVCAPSEPSHSDECSPPRAAPSALQSTAASAAGAAAKSWCMSW